MNRFFNISMIAILFAISVLAMDIPVSQAVSETGVPTPAFPASPAQEEAPPPNSHAANQPNHFGNSPVPPRALDDSHFVTDTGGWLDQYLFRDDVPNGLLTFDIEIDRYYSPLITDSSVDANGFLWPSVWQDLIDKHLLPEKATLTLEVWDVDHEGSPCPEVDYVFINDKPVLDPSGTTTATLASGNNTWSTWSISFPIEMLKFPTEKGKSGGQRPTPAVNEIAVKIDVDCGPHWWAVEVDWGEIHIPSPIRPIIFAHGWTGDTHAFDNFENWLAEDGIPSAGQVDLFRGIQPIAQTSPQLAISITHATSEFGVDKLNLFAHSKGGLVSRHALRTDDVAEKIERLITFASPHHGTEWSDIAIYAEGLLKAVCRKNLNTSDENTIQLCYEAALEFGIKRIREEFNYRGCYWEWLSLPPGWSGCIQRYVQQPYVDYRSFATASDAIVVPYYSTTYPWNSDEVPFPTEADVDEVYRFPSHSGLKEIRNAYQCAISYIDPEIHGSFLNCALFNLNSQLTATDKITVLLVDGELQTVFMEGGSLAANNTEVLEASLDGAALSIFDAYSTAPLDFTLITPGGQIIDPSVAASDPSITYSFQEDGLWWWYQYQVTDPEVDTWKNVLYASDEADFFVWNRTQSTTQLNVNTDIFTYRPGDLVTLEAALSDGTTLLTGATITGQVTQPDDSTLTLSFYDDGTHGDATANDGIQTAQFNASSTNGHATIELNAAQGNATRSLNTSIAVATQTAQFQQVTNETPIDSNGNGLNDSLDLELSVNVITSGHFEFQGMLVDESDQLITTAYYSTLMAGTGPLPAGLQTITLSFDGEAIQQHGVDGPYTLTNLSINDVSDYSLVVDSATDVYTTATYQADQFERSLLSLAGGSEEVMDADANGRYDQLTISVTLNVVVIQNC